MDERKTESKSKRHMVRESWKFDAKSRGKTKFDSLRTNAKQNTEKRMNCSDADQYSELMYMSIVF